MTPEQRNAVDSSALMVVSFGEDNRMQVMCMVTQTYHEALIRRWPDLSGEAVKSNWVNFVAAVNRRVREIGSTGGAAATA